MRGEAALPTDDARPHSLSQWIGSEASARFVDHAAFKAVPPLLQAVRTLVSAQRQAPAQGERALACLGELHGLRNDLLGHLQTLQREIHLS